MYDFIKTLTGSGMLPSTDCIVQHATHVLAEVHAAAVLGMMCLAHDHADVLQDIAQDCIAHDGIEHHDASAGDVYTIMHALAGRCSMCGHEDFAGHVNAQAAWPWLHDLAQGHAGDYSKLLVHVLDDLGVHDLELQHVARVLVCWHDYDNAEHEACMSSCGDVIKKHTAVHEVLTALDQVMNTVQETAAAGSCSAGAIASCPVPMKKGKVTRRRPASSLFA